MGFSENIKRRGYYQKGIFSILQTIVANFNNLCIKLDNDGGVTDADYASSLAINVPSIGGAGKDIQNIGMPQGKTNLLMKTLRTNFNALCDKLAADAGVNGTTVFTAQKFASTVDLIDVSDADFTQRGEHQYAIVDFLDHFINQFNFVVQALDGDTGVTDTNYDALYHIGDSVEVSSSSSSSRSSSSCSSSSSCRSSSSSSSSSSLSSSSSSCRSSSSSSSSCRSSSSSSSCSSSSSSSRSSSSSSRSSSSSSSSSRSSSSSSSSSSCRSSSSSSSRSSSSCSSSSSSSRSSSSSSSSCRSSSSSSSSSAG